MRLLPAAGLAIALACGAGAADGATAAPGPSWRDEVAPLLARRCGECHDADVDKGGLDVTSVARLLKGGKKAGPAVLPGDPAASPLIRSLVGELKPAMPKDAAPLPEAEVAVLRAWIAAGARDDSVAYPAEQVAFFENRIRPLLANNCLSCHGGDHPKNDLQLGTRAGILHGGRRGPAAVAGDPAASLLLRAVRHAGELKMPLGRPQLAAAQIADLERWIAMGLPWPSTRSVLTRSEGFAIRDEDRAHWSFRPLPPAPAGDLSAAIDRLIDERLAREGVEPSPAAERTALLRRLHLDLVGLPPTPAEVEAFLADRSAAAAERVVDRLLASPHFGVRWGRHWLDYARWGAKHCVLKKEPGPGQAFSVSVPHERYRRWVVDAVNADLPFDRFVAMQVAGDLMPAADGEADLDGLVATSALLMGPFEFINDPTQRFDIANVVNDQIEFVGRSVLGLSLECARCHDHKTDPISQRDYYALAGVFTSSSWALVADARERSAQAEARRLWDRAMAVQIELIGIHRDHRDALTLTYYRRKAATGERMVREGRAALAQLAADAPAKRRGDIEREIRRGQADLDEYAGKARDLEAAMRAAGKELEPPALAREAALKQEKVALQKQAKGFLAMQDGGPYPARAIGDAVLSIDGEVQKQGPAVPRRLPELFTSGGQVRLGDERSSGRLDLARWLTARDNPLTPRAQANRLWMRLFGEPLAASPTDLGLAGAKPTHPELLDLLARRFVDDGWSLKRLVRAICLSRAYQRSSRPTPSALAKDGENRLLARQNRRRVDAEVLRDAIAACAPQGPRLDGPISARALFRPDEGFGELFDGAGPLTIEARRGQSVLATQALFLLNGEALWGPAAALAEASRGASPAERVAGLWMRVYGRAPDEAEQAFAQRFLAEQLAWQAAGRRVAPAARPERIVHTVGYDTTPDEKKGKAKPPPEPPTLAGEDLAVQVLAHVLLMGSEFIFQE